MSGEKNSEGREQGEGGRGEKSSRWLEWRMGGEDKGKVKKCGGKEREKNRIQIKQGRR